MTSNDNAAAGLARTELTVTGMNCSNCARHVTEALLSVTGVDRADRHAGDPARFHSLAAGAAADVAAWCKPSSEPDLTRNQGACAPPNSQSPTFSARCHHAIHRFKCHSRGPLFAVIVGFVRLGFEWLRRQNPARWTACTSAATSAAAPAAQRMEARRVSSVTTARSTPVTLNRASVTWARALLQFMPVTVNSVRASPAAALSFDVIAGKSEPPRI